MVFIVIFSIIGGYLCLCIKFFILLGFNLWFIGLMVVVFLIRVGGVVDELDVWIWNLICG